MAEKLFVPLVGSSVTHEGDGASQPTRQPAQEPGAFRDGVYYPPVGKYTNSINHVRMRPAQVETEAVPEWKEISNSYGTRAELNWTNRPVEAPQSNDDALSHQAAMLQQQVTNLTSQVSNMMGNQYGNNGNRQFGGQQSAPRPPNPVDFDMYDDESVAEFHRQTEEYIDARVAAAMAPHNEVLQDAKWGQQYNACLAEHNDDPNFKETMNEALEMVLASGGQLSIPEAYRRVDDPRGARLGRRGNAHLPESLRDRRNGVKSFGRIIEHNHQAGRAKPFRGR